MGGMPEVRARNRTVLFGISQVCVCVCVYVLLEVVECVCAMDAQHDSSCSPVACVTDAPMRCQGGAAKMLSTKVLDVPDGLASGRTVSGHDHWDT
eukprot:scaffold158372_cov27-Tisochrysis_lutea.AAC.1